MNQLIAEEVAQISPELITREKEGKPQTVHEAVNAMLLKEYNKVQNLEVIVLQQQKQIETLAAGLEKVNAKAEIINLGQQVVNNP